MAPLLLGATGAWLLGNPSRETATVLTALWAAAILAFLAGVRRGLSFRTEGGPRFTQIATMFVLFSLAFCSLVAAVFNQTAAAIAIVLVGFAMVLVLDPIAARKAEAPLFFARLRPPQIIIAIASLTALLMASLWR